jgi:UDP:flavonoid glycosyltransferase YjiC (YdhE family)
VEGVNPSLVVMDSRLAFYSLLLRSNKSHIIINTKLSTYQWSGVPPLESVRVSKNRLLDKVLANWNWLHFWRQYHLTAWVRKAALLNYDETYFYERFMNGRIQPNRLGRHLFDSLHPALQAVPKVITYPKALEFSWKPAFSDEWYIEMPFERDESAYQSDDYHRVMDTVLARKATATTSVYIVYCSLGTLTGSQAIRAGIYLEKVLKALVSEADVELIVATANIMLAPVKALNVHTLVKVPQLDLLQHCDLMITHGGLNSMTECLQTGVPMLAAPLIPRSDHCGNVARIEANGYGLSGDMLTDSPETIRRKARRILSNPIYRHRVQAAKLQTQTERQHLMNQLLEKTLAKVD